MSDLRELLEAAYHALRSYEYGNAATELAKELADRIEAALHPQPASGEGQAELRSAVNEAMETHRESCQQCQEVGEETCTGLLDAIIAAAHPQAEPAQPEKK